MAFVEFKASCSKIGYVAEYLTPLLTLPNRAFGGLYSRIPKLTCSSYPRTEVYFNSRASVASVWCRCHTVPTEWCCCHSSTNLSLSTYFTYKFNNLRAIILHFNNYSTVAFKALVATKIPGDGTLAPQHVGIVT